MHVQEELRKAAAAVAEAAAAKADALAQRDKAKAALAVAKQVCSCGGRRRWCGGINIAHGHGLIVLLLLALW